MVSGSFAYLDDSCSGDFCGSLFIPFPRSRFDSADSSLSGVVGCLLAAAPELPYHDGAHSLDDPVFLMRRRDILLRRFFRSCIRMFFHSGLPDCLSGGKGGFFRGAVDFEADGCLYYIPSGKFLSDRRRLEKAGGIEKPFYRFRERSSALDSPGARRIDLSRLFFGGESGSGKLA